jgi:Papain-like cysteine protease AvrRpt2
MGFIAALRVGPQLQARWCWAAVAEGVARCYSRATTWTQCHIANAELGRSICCFALIHQPCNRRGRLGSALRQVGHLRQSPKAGQASFTEIQNEVAAQQPTGVAIAWRGGGAHFIAIRGYAIDDQNVNWVELEDPDPIVGNITVRYSELVANYRGQGDWSHMYATSATGQTGGASGPHGTGHAEPFAP